MITTVGWSEPSHAMGREMGVKNTGLGQGENLSNPNPLNCCQTLPWAPSTSLLSTNTTTPRKQGWHIPNQHTQ